MVAGLSVTTTTGEQAGCRGGRGPWRGARGMRRAEEEEEEEVADDPEAPEEPCLAVVEAPESDPSPSA